MKRIVNQSSNAGGVAFAESEKPTPAANEVVIDVKSFSLNRGELGIANSGDADGRPIGWDIAGVVSRAAADGSGPAVGERVVAFSAAMTGWAEQVAVPTADVAGLPDEIDFTIAAALPVAGLTAFQSLSKGGSLLGKKVLITGATGGVGSFAIQLAKASGAEVVGQVRKESQVDAIKSLGAHHVAVTSDGAGLESHGPFDLVVDGVAGELFPSLVRNLAADGTIVSYGVTGGYDVQFAAYPDFFGGDARRTIYALNLYSERQSHPVSQIMPRLLKLVVRGDVKPDISRVDDWSKTDDVAAALLGREFSGKAVLTIG